MIRSFRVLLIVILVGVATVPVLALTYPFTRAVSKIVETGALREVSLTAESLSRDMRSYVTILVTQTFALSRDSDVQRATSSILFADKANFLLSRFLEDNSLVSALFLLNEQLKLNTAVPAGAGTRMAGLRELLQEFQEIPDQPAFYRFLRSEGGASFLLAVPVKGPLKRPTGMIIAEIRVEDLKMAVQARVQEPTTAQLFVDDTQGAGLSPKFLNEHFVSRSPLVIESSTPGRVFAMKVLVAEPKSVRLAIVHSTIRKMLFGSLLLVLIVGLGGYSLANRLNRPFRRLNEHIQKYESGNYKAPPPPFDMDEFRLIANTLQTMGTKISAHIEAAGETERARGEVERTRLETELNSLHQQMQPHFLFNTLNNISTVVRMDPERAVGLLNRLSDLYRLTLEMSKTNTVPLSKELRVLSHYLDLQQMRFGGRLSFSIPPEDGFESVQIPGLLIQTLVENAVKHGIAKAREGGAISVTIEKTEGLYRCEISNTGAPYSPAPKKGLESNGTGLENTIKRLDLLYGERHRFRIRNDGGGRTVVDFFFTGEPV
ncbi:MAG TPA: histidine kinase [Bdellovibrionota bacterium]|nr:histidine kinase [Bdellovibrionota bacterium]